MRRWLPKPRAWPMAVKVPLLAAGLTVMVAVVISNVVLRRVADEQTAQLRQLSEAYLDGLGAALILPVLRQDVWETFDTLDRARGRYQAVKARYTLATLKDGSVLAASEPRDFPTGSRLPEALAQRFAEGEGPILDERQALAWVRRGLSEDGIVLGSVVAEIDIRDLLAVRREVLLTLVLVNAALTVLFGTAAYLLVRRTVRPVALLTAYVERVRDGRVEAIPARHVDNPSTELGRLFASFNAMAAALRERETLARRLAEKDRVAQLGKLASGLAHEVNNPLGGMLNVVSTLRKHGGEAHVRERCLDLIERGLRGISDVVRATLATYKGPLEAAQLRCHDLDDLQFLLQHEIHRHRLRLAWHNALPQTLDTDGAAVRQIALNLLLNACAAAPTGGRVGFAARSDMGWLKLTVTDDGPGLPKEVQQLYQSPAAAPTVPSGLRGLGVWSICRLVCRLGGRIEAASDPGHGTSISVGIPLGPKVALDAVA